MNSINFRTDIEDLVWQEIYPGIMVYKNMLSDPKKAYKIMERSERSSKGKYFFQDWTPWAHFGTYTQPKGDHELSDIDKSEVFLEEKELYEEVSIAYEKAVSHYFSHTGIKIPENSKFSGQSWCKYFNKIDTLKNQMTMQYHTDYIISERDMPGDKYHTTCTFYINDNYNGGEIEFYINGDIVCHKPDAGDMVVFPSNEPYFHGVKTIPDGNKFFIRNFVVYPFDGTKEWLENQRRFGAYRWSKKEIERIEYENPRNMLYLKDGNIVKYEDVVNVNDNGNNYGN